MNSSSDLIEVEDSVKKAEVEREKRSILKNVVLISFGFTLLFTAYSAMSSLQSSINPVRK